ncbi:glycosyltransferase [Burkholderia cepacia]|uniref:glycosyltransferase n=1 Tax=Burkholderia cepacia TaxID=292 RepID=UPI002ABDC776|nr:glycosyltransferase [Burkholderia cepacia]
MSRSKIDKNKVSYRGLISYEGEHFLRVAYQAVLNRAPDPQGLTYYTARLNNGVSKTEILAQLRLSPEGKSREITVEGLDDAIKAHVRQKNPIIKALNLSGFFNSEARIARNYEASDEWRAAVQAVSSSVQHIASVLDEQRSMLKAVKSMLGDGEQDYGSTIPTEAEHYFDSAWYVAQYPDVAESGMSPLIHFEKFGWKEYRNPNGYFDTQYYLSENPDVQLSGVNPFFHWIKYGRHENRRINPYINSDYAIVSQPAAEMAFASRVQSPEEMDPARALFDAPWYLQQYPDVISADMDPWEHFSSFGWREGRRPNREFNTSFYIDSNPDVAQAGVNPLHHWALYGKAEGRKIEQIKVSPRGKIAPVNSPSLIFVSHEASRTGAPAVLLSLMRWIKENTNIKFSVVIGYGGPWNSEFEKIADCFYLDRNYRRSLRDELREFCGNHVKVVYANTIASGFYAEHLRFLNAKFVTHVHEMENVFKIFESNFDALKGFCSEYIAVSKGSYEAIVKRVGTKSAKITKLPPFIEKGRNSDGGDAFIPSRKAIFGCGAVEFRKGFDIFCDVATELIRAGYSDFMMYWIGAATDELNPNAEIQRRGLVGHVEWLGIKSYPRDYFSSGALFLLPSREDPFPLVCMEAAECSLPIICFDERAGDMHTFVEDDAGVVVAHGDAAAMAAAAHALLTDESRRSKLGAAAKEKVKQRHYADVVVPAILDLLPEMERVDVTSELDSYIKAIQDKRAISFDIFDTLVTRRVDNPEIVFDVIEQDLTKSEGALIPLFDERMATAGRVLSRRAGIVDDISIDDIYHEMSFYKNPEAEKRIEINMCVPHPIGIELYKAAVKLDKIIYITSDMYLDRKTIETILKNCGINKWSKLFLSSEVGKKKHTGRLYAELIETAKSHGVGKADIVHIGDSWVGDIDRAREKNLAALRFTPLYDKPYRMFSLSKEKCAELSQDGRIWNSFCEQSTKLWIEAQQERANDFFTRLGFELTGPLAAMIAMFVRQEAIEKGAKKIVFMARDGRVIKNAFDTIYHSDVEAGTFESLYLNLSRATVVPASLENPLTSNDSYFLIEGLHLACKPLSYYFNKAGLNLYDREIAKVVKKQFHNLDYIPNWDDLPKLSKIFDQLSNQIHWANKKNRDALKAYLLEAGFDDAENIIVVDVGWYLNIQSRLAKFLKSIGARATLHGCYVGSQARIDKSVSHSALLFERGDPYMYAKSVADNTTLFEVLFSAPEASAAALEIDENGRAKVVFNQLTMPPDSEFLIAQKIHAGAEDFFLFAKDAIADFLPPAVAKDFFFALFDCFVTTDDPLAIASFAKFDVKLGGAHDLASTQSLIRNDSFVEYVLDREDEYFEPISILGKAAQNVVIVTSAGRDNGSTRYRALNLLKSLSACGIGGTLIHAATDIDQASDLIEHADAVIFQRCFEDQGNVGALLKVARKFGVRCVGEMDDLVFPDFIASVGSVAGGEWDLHQAKFVSESYMAFVKKMDACIVSTPTLQKYLGGLLDVPVAIFRNKIEEKYFNAREASSDEFRILYSSGTYSHKVDFQLISDALIGLLLRNPKVRLSVLGAAQVPEELLGLPNVHSYGVMPYGTMLEFVSKHDLVLVPLEENIFNEAKSSVKFIESGAVGVPVLATKIGEFDFAIRDGINGFLASSLSDWERILEEIVVDFDRAFQAGKQAYNDVRASYCTDRMEGEALDAILGRVTLPKKHVRS